MANGCTLCIRGKTSAEWRAVLKTVDITIATPSMMGKWPREIVLQLTLIFFKIGTILRITQISRYLRLPESHARNVGGLRNFIR